MAPRTRSSTKRQKRSNKSEVTVEVVIERDTCRKSNQKIRREARIASTAILIPKLIDDVWLNILEHLTWKERQVCRLTCQYWNSIIISMDPPPILGSLARIKRKMAKYSIGVPTRTLSLALDDPGEVNSDDGSGEYSDEDDEEDEAEASSSGSSDLQNSFPSATLEEIECHRYHDREMDGGEESSRASKHLWKCITSCSQLKVLNWHSRESNTGSRYSRAKPGPCIEYSLKGTPLAECRLDKLTFDTLYEPEIDDAFYQMISNVKYLNINCKFTPTQLETIFDTIKNVIEEFTFTNYTDGIESWGRFDKLEEKMKAKTIEMPKLRKCNAAFRLIGSEYSRHQLPSPCQIIAPQVTSLSFIRSESIDWILLESCRGTLQSLSVGTGGSELPDGLQRELFNMPALVDLTMDLTNDGSSDYRCSDAYFFSTFWAAMDSGNTGRSDITIKDVLPKLKSLTLVHDIRLRAERIISFLDRRIQLGLTPIESLTIWLNEYDEKSKLTTAQIDELRSKIPKVEIIEGEEVYNAGFFCDVQCNRGYPDCSSLRRMKIRNSLSLTNR